MTSDELRQRTKEFAKRTINLFRKLPHSSEALMIRKQLFRASTSAGANHRAACRGHSRAEFVAKLGIVLEEADESVYWMELLVEMEIVKPELLADLIDEGRQLVAIFVASLNTAKS